MLPVIVALVLYWRRGGFESEAGLLNGDEAAPSSPRSAARARAAEGDDRLRSARTCVAVVGGGAAGCGRREPGDSGELVRTRAGLSRSAQGKRASPADEFLRTQRVDPESYRHVSWPAAHWEGADALAGKYFLERMPPGRATSLFERYRPLQHWTTRYFRPLDREELLVSVHPETARCWR